MKMTSLEGCGNTYNKIFYQGYWERPGTPEVEEILRKWRRRGNMELAYPPMELFKQGWRVVLTAYYNLNFAVSKMEDNGLDLTSEDMVICCQCFGVPPAVWKTCWILRDGCTMIAANPESTG